MDRRSKDEVLQELAGFNKRRKQAGLSTLELTRPTGDNFGTHDSRSQIPRLTTDWSGPADYMRRFVACLVDGFILSFGASILALPLIFIIFGDLKELLASGQIASFLIRALFAASLWLVVWVGLVRLSDHMLGSTPGRLLMQIRVRRAGSDESLSFWRWGWRETSAKGISSMIFFIGYLMPLFREDKKALHDLMSNTEVQQKSDELSPIRWIVGLAFIVIWFGIVLRSKMP